MLFKKRFVSYVKFNLCGHPEFVLANSGNLTTVEQRVGPPPSQKRTERLLYNYIFFALPRGGAVGGAGSRVVAGSGRGGAVGGGRPAGAVSLRVGGGAARPHFRMCVGAG